MFLHLLRRVTMNLLPSHYEVAMMKMMTTKTIMMTTMKMMMITMMIMMIKAAASFLLQVPRRSCTRRLPENRTNTI